MNEFLIGLSVGICSGVYFTWWFKNREIADLEKEHEQHLQNLHKNLKEVTYLNTGICEWCNIEPKKSNNSKYCKKCTNDV